MKTGKNQRVLSILLITLLVSGFWMFTFNIPEAQAYTPSYQNALTYNYGFEYGNMTDWTVGGTVSASGSNPYSGTYHADMIAFSVPAYISAEPSLTLATADIYEFSAMLLVSGGTCSHFYLRVYYTEGFGEGDGWNTYDVGLTGAYVKYSFPTGSLAEGKTVSYIKLEWSTVGGSPHVYIDDVKLLYESGSLEADLENIDDSGVGFVFTNWRYYIFTVHFPSTIYSGEPHLAWLTFDVPTGNGTVLTLIVTDGETWNFSAVPVNEDRTLGVLLIKNSVAVEDATGWHVSFRIWFTDKCLDVWDEDNCIDVSYIMNDTDGGNSGWIESEDFFRIYSKGGYSLEDPVASGNSGVVSGGDQFSFYAWNNSAVNNEMVFRDLQHLKMCPEIRFYAGRAAFSLRYGVDYSVGDGEWLEGWYVVLQVDAVSYTGVFASNVWINMTATWYNRGEEIRSEDLYMFYHGEVYNEGDIGRFKIWIDLWFNKINASSTCGGRINAYEFPMQDESAAWLRWLSSSWGVKDNVLKESMFVGSLLDENNETLSSEKIKIVKVWSQLSVGAGEGSFQFVTQDQFEVFDLTFSRELPLTGIQTPTFEETVMPAMRNTGVLGAIWSMFAGIGAWLSENLLFGGLNLWGTFVAFLDTIAGWLGAPGFFTNLFNWIGEGFTYLGNSAVYAWNLLANIFLLTGSLLAAFVTTIGELIGSFVTTISHFVDFMGGGIGAAGNLWDQLGIMIWLTIAIIFYPLYLLILWEEKGMDAVIQQLTWIFGILVFLYHFFEGLFMGIISLITSLIESIPVAE